MRIQVIGATGFLGGHLCRELLRRGHDVTALARQFPDGSCPSSHALDVAAGDFDLPAPTDAVVYLAQCSAYRDFPSRFPDMLSVGPLGLARTAKAALAAGCRRLLFASTGNVYVPAFEPLTEDMPLRRDEPYALSKVMAEEALDLFAEDLDVCCLRLFGLFGPGQRAMLPVKLRANLVAEEPIQLSPSPDEAEAGEETEGLRVSFTYVEDAASAIACLLEASAPPPRLLNVAGPEAVTLRTFSSGMARVLGIEPRYQQMDTPRPFDLIADVRRLRNICSPEFTPLSTALEHFVAGTG